MGEDRDGRERNRNGKRERERQGWERKIEREARAGEREIYVERQGWERERYRGERESGERYREREREKEKKFMEFYLVVLHSAERSEARQWIVARQVLC